MSPELTSHDPGQEAKLHWRQVKLDANKCSLSGLGSFLLHINGTKLQVYLLYEIFASTAAL